MMPPLSQTTPAISPTPDQLRFREMENAGENLDFESAVGLLNAFRPADLPRIYLNQRVAEWKRFIAFLQNRGFPKTILEIGTGRGGSAFFWSRFSPAGSRIITVDLAEKAAQAVAVYERPEANKVCCITGDSRAPGTIDAVRRALEGRPIELLYLDGDHTYPGVKGDYDAYLPFCGEKGLIAFHDIHLDFSHAKGIKTSCDSGEVFQFWNEIKDGRTFHEFIEEPREEQDGFGIGVIEK